MLGNIFIIWTVAFLTGVLALIDCDNVVHSEMDFMGQCNNKWSNLKKLTKPMQREVGYAWVQHKLDSFFDSSKNAQSEMDETIIPAVIGPDSFFYVVDHHHELAALDYSGYSSTVVTVQVLCDRRNSTLDEFWSDMTSLQYVYLAAHPDANTYEMPTPINPNQLPVSFSFTEDDKTLADDPWRALASFSRKVNAPDSVECEKDSEYCMRCFYRGCGEGNASSGPGVPFFEYRWSYFMLYSSMYDTSYWPSTAEHDDFLTAYNTTFSNSQHFGSYHVEDWSYTASLAVALCRAEATGTYTLPQDIFEADQASTLPGYVMGYEPMEEDPDCDAPKSC
jgi:hypothetical protein